MFLQMLLWQKHKNILLLGFSLLLIAYFIGIRAFFLVHQFSHHPISFGQKVVQEDGQKVLENKTVSKKFSQKQDDDNDCPICHLAYLYQSNVLLFSALVYSLIFLIFDFGFFSKGAIRISSLFYSYQTRAPPLVL